jgi:catechol 2,3-dioxygenase-like lactoylglutathione lyase family enzyme
MLASMSRPPVAIGHVTLRVADVARAAEFYGTLGLRPVMQRKAMAILELRGGTHLLLFRAMGKPKRGPLRSFDFMVDDVDKAHARLLDAGLTCSDIASDRVSGHHKFEVTDPDGHVLTVYSTHAEGREV